MLSKYQEIGSKSEMAQHDVLEASRDEIIFDYLTFGLAIEIIMPTIKM